MPLSTRWPTGSHGRAHAPAALGIALVGSVLSVAYRNALGPAVEALPEPLRADAADSLGATLAVRAQAGGRAAELTEAAFRAFQDGQAAAVLTAAGVALAGAVLCALLLPGRISSCPGGREQADLMR